MALAVQSELDVATPRLATLLYIYESPLASSPSTLLYYTPG